MNALARQEEAVVSKEFVAEPVSEQAVAAAAPPESAVAMSAAAAVEVVAVVVVLGDAAADSVPRSPEPRSSPSQGPKNRLRDPHLSRVLGCWSHPVFFYRF